MIRIYPHLLPLLGLELERIRCTLSTLRNILALGCCASDRPPPNKYKHSGFKYRRHRSNLEQTNAGACTPTRCEPHVSRNGIHCLKGFTKRNCCSLGQNGTRKWKEYQPRHIMYQSRVPRICHENHTPQVKAWADEKRKKRLREIVEVRSGPCQELSGCIVVCLKNEKWIGSRLVYYTSARSLVVAIWKKNNCNTYATGQRKNNNHPQPSPSPSTLNPQPLSSPSPSPSLSPSPLPSTLNPQPSTLNPQPSTLNPQPVPVPVP